MSTPLDILLRYYFITSEGLINEKYADVNRSIFSDAQTVQLDKDVSLPTFGIFLYNINYKYK